MDLDPSVPTEPSSSYGTPEARAAVVDAALVLNCLPRALVIWDVHGTVVAWNTNAERLYGWSVAEALGRHVGELLILPSELDEMSDIARGVESGESWDGDITILRPDGASVRVHTSLRPLRDRAGAIVGALGVASDVTTQRAVEERAAELTNHLLMALAGGELGTWRRDLLTGKVVWDATMEGLYGLEPGTYDGTVDSWFAKIHPDDRDGVAAVTQAAVEAGESYELEYRIVRPDGSIRWLQGRAMLTRDDEGNFASSIGCSGDITDRKLIELENARRAVEAEQLVEHGRLQRDRLEFLAGLNEAAMGAANHRDMMRAVTAAAVPSLGDWCSLHFFEGSTAAANPEIIVAHRDPDRVSLIHDILVRHPYDPDAPIGAAAAVREGTTQFIPLFAGELRELIIERAVRATPQEAREILDTLAPTSLIAVPLITKRGVIGAMQFVSAESGREYQADDVSLAETAAGRVAEALDSAWLRDQQRNVANVLQSALLPAHLPDLDGASIAVRYWAAGAASEVGGDFYDVFRIPNREAIAGDVAPDRWAIVIGDVCGTGPEAAAVTALARHTIRAAARHGASPVEVLEWLNEAVLGGDGDRFCTVLYCTLERAGADTWTFTSVTGGHPLPFLVRPGQSAQPLGGSGTLIGVLPTLRLAPHVATLTTGDTVVLNTDGVTDVPDPYGIDDDAMAELVTRAAACPGAAEGVAEQLGAAVQRVLPIPDRDDDIALVVIRIDGDIVDLTGGSISADAATPGADAETHTEVVAEREFAPDVSSVSAAREFAVVSAGDPHHDESLRLAVSELATNAVIHARSAFRVRVLTAGRALRVEVHDLSDRLPVHRHGAIDAVNGRGIDIVDDVSSRWGVTPLPSGKSVWFELQS